jgi:hypothetical protein
VEGDEADGEPEPLWTRRVAGSLLSFTPPAVDCPARGGRFAWSVRVIGAETASEWSEPLFFEVESMLSEDDLALALEILRRRAEGGANGKSIELSARRDAAERTAAIGRSPRVVDGAGAGIVRERSAAFEQGNPHASLEVAGEVRTIDPEDPSGPPLLWGRGRPGVEVHGRLLLPSAGIEIPCVHDGVKFGLSNVTAEWGEAADACPAGTWVCRASEIVACNTARPASQEGATGRRCDGDLIYHEADGHVGWVADKEPLSNYLAAARRENGAINGGLTSDVPCLSLPVWCCWE